MSSSRESIHRRIDEIYKKYSAPKALETDFDVMFLGMDLQSLKSAVSVEILSNPEIKTFWNPLKADLDTIIGLCDNKDKTTAEKQAELLKHLSQLLAKIAPSVEKIPPAPAKEVKQESDEEKAARKEDEEL